MPTLPFTKTLAREQKRLLTQAEAVTRPLDLFLCNCLLVN